MRKRIVQLGFRVLLLTIRLRYPTICFALAIVLLSPFASAQWVQTNGPYLGPATCFAVNSGLDQLPVRALGLNDKCIHVGKGEGGMNYVGGSGVWRRPISEMVTSVQLNIDGDMPKEFVLDQNFPNPYNPETKIEYRISKIENVTLTVYDILGREVRALVNERKAPGSYSASFDANGLASGVYIYRLTAGCFVQTRKMTLVR